MGNWKELITLTYKHNNGGVSRSMPHLSKRSMKCLRLGWRINGEYVFAGFFRHPLYVEETLKFLSIAIASVS